MRREGVDLARLLREVVEKLSPQAEQARVEVRLELPPELSVVGDVDRLAQVFTNLLDNGIKFSPQGGWVKLSATQVEDWAQVSIEDTGPGIPDKEAGRIFERFYQVDKARKGGDQRGAGPTSGTGLGLAIAKEIVNAHRGEISLRATTPHGSIFVVTIPTR
jgi:signal transduction histidine kinase